MKKILNEIKNKFIEWKNIFMQEAKKNSIQLGMILLMLILSYQFGYLLILPLALLIFYFHYKKDDFLLTLSPKLNLLYAFLFSLFIFLASQYVINDGNYLLMPKQDTLGEILIMTLGIALLEEMFFRGYLFNLLKKYMSPTMFIIILSLIYGLYMQSVAGLILGIGLTLMTYYTHSIYPSLFANFMIRILFVTQMFHKTYFQLLNSLYSLNSKMQSLGLLCITLGCLFIAFSFVKKCTYYKVEEKENIYPVYKPTHHKRVYKRKFIH